MRPGASPQSRRYVFTGPGEVSSLVTDPPGTPVTPCSIMIIRKGEERRKKREKFYIYSDDTHTNNMVTHLYGHTHTQLRPTQRFRIQLCHTHTTLSHNLSSTISFISPASPIPSSHCASWKKLTCGVVWSFTYSALFS